MTTYIKYFVSINEHEVLSTYDEILKRNSHLINPRPELFHNLKSFLLKHKNKFMRILLLYGGATSSYVVTDVGLSHLINCSMKNELPENDEDLKSICFIVFQIFDPKEVRRGGTQIIFDKFTTYLESLKKNVEPDGTGIFGVSVALIVDILTIKVDYSTITYVVKYQGCVNVRNEIAKMYSHQLGGDHIGSFRGSDINSYDAVSFMSVRVKINTVVCVLNNMVDIGPGFYKQLLAEANVLLKFKRFMVSGLGKRSILHGNDQYGFVRPLDEAKKSSCS